MYSKDLCILISKHAKEIVEMLVKNQMHFYIQCDVTKVQFDPILPPHISGQFQQLIDFVLAGYTFDSIEIWDNDMSFEAGFGRENIGSLVLLPFSSIVQIAIPVNDGGMRDMCIFMNTISLLGLDSRQDDEVEEDELLNSSKNAILSNPQNQFLKK